VREANSGAGVCVIFLGHVSKLGLASWLPRPSGSVRSSRQIPAGHFVSHAESTAITPCTFPVDARLLAIGYCWQEVLSEGQIMLDYKVLHGP
jgi:hypothetical protein